MDDELLQQFLMESRELVASGTADLLALERSPGDSGGIDSAFRAFHTLKGAAGIIGFDAMSRALHAAEDALAAVRSGATLSRDVVDACLSCLDQVGRWLDAIEIRGEPPSGAGPEAEAVVARFQHDKPAKTPLTAPAGHRQEWLAALLDRHLDLHGMAPTALRYVPDPACFFRGEDPVAAITALPGILRLDLIPVAPWPAPEEFDPFRCRLELHVLGSLPADAMRQALPALSGIVTILDVPVAIPLAPTAQAFLEAQMAVLADRTEAGLAGRLGAAARVAGNVLRRAGRAADASAVESALAAALADEAPDPLLAVLTGIVGREAPVPVAHDAAPGAEPVAPASARTLRVDVDRIEALVSLAGELIVLKNAIGYSVELALSQPEALAPRLKDQHAALERISAELREAVLGVRVLPFRTVFQRFPRLVRDLAASLGRNIELRTSGEDTEADKAVVEALFEPLLHLVRNAADHGIEPVDARVARGKAAAGQIRMSAARDGDNVVIEVADDGRGIDAGRIRAIAAERGLADAEALARLDDAAVLDFIFAPGFSTADSVTNVSGRGVGMDAVRAGVERLGGRVTVRSTPGAGSVVTLRLPVSVMVTRLMTVEVGGQPFGIPLDAVVETALVSRQRITRVGSAEAFVLRNRTMPLIHLRTALGRRVAEAADVARVVVVSAAGEFGALEVDRLGDRLDAIVTPMAGLLGAAPGISGTTLLGDGRVLIVVDVEELLA